MNERKKIYNVLMDFLTIGLVEKDIERLLKYFDEEVLGIGMGEQGFVTSLQDVRYVMESGRKEEDTAGYRVETGRVECKLFGETLGMICAEVKVHAYQPDNGRRGISEFQQSLIVTKKEKEWKICGLHASTPTITEEGIESYPFKIAEKTLNNLREKIGEEVYLQEEQYRKAVLSDAIAFYMINFTKDVFDKCYLQNDICVYVEPGTPYAKCVREKTLEYVHPEERDIFGNCLAVANIQEAFANGRNEVSCQYRMIDPDGNYIWTKTIVRLITDVQTGEQKGIMYVKNIDEEKRQAENIQQEAERDSMTKLLNRGTFVRETERLLCNSGNGGILLMMDADNFKQVNDTYGHPIGDKVLIFIAQGLTEYFGKDGLVSRFGGDEFLVFVQCKGIDENFHARVDAFLNHVRTFELPEYPTLKISVSIGGAYLQDCSFEELYRRADEALYKSKAQGKNTARFL